MAAGSIDPNHVVLSQCIPLQAMNMRDDNRIIVSTMFVHYNGCKATKGRLKVLNNHNPEQNANVQVNIEERIIQHRKEDMSTTTEHLSRNFPRHLFNLLPPTPLPISPLQPFSPSGEIQQTLTVQELSHLTELTGRIGIVVLPPDHPSMTPRRIPLSLPQPLFCVGPRARHDLVDVEHLYWDFSLLQIEIEGPLGAWGAYSVVI